MKYEEKVTISNTRMVVVLASAGVIWDGKNRNNESHSKWGEKDRDD